MLTVKDVTKRYSNQLAVNKLSFTINTGTIFGLLGPNGAGKSSLLRMITGITQPDEGQIFINNQPFDNNKHNAIIGYMPEEKGLYKKMKVFEQVEYLGLLKGMGKKELHESINHWFKKLDISSWANKKTEDLSKGMHQKLQFIITVLHKPSLLILDEPFSGLDPVNAELIKQEIYNLAKDGATIIFSTHRMEQVEEICDNIVLINKGENILEGNVNDIKQQYKQNELEVTTNNFTPNTYNTFELHSTNKNKLILKLKQGFTNNNVLQELINNNIHIEGFTEKLPSLNDIFIRLVDGSATTKFAQ
jgi:ABC-2 type transport system ATP-binding protein